MATIDKRPKIKLSEDETKRLVDRLEEMIGEAEEFRKSSEWGELHADYWRMYRAEPVSKVRNWPWPNASNLYVPLTKVAINVGMAQEYEAMLSTDPKVIGMEGEDQQLADDLSAYYFDYYFKKVMPIKIWGTDFLLDNSVDGISAVKARQNTEFKVRRYEELAEIPVMTDTPVPGIDGAISWNLVQTGTDYEWQEKAIIERINETALDVCDMGRIYMAPKTGAGIKAGGALYEESCPWYYHEFHMPWDKLLQNRRNLGYEFDEEELKAHLREADTSPKDETIGDNTGTNASIAPPGIRHLEFYMPWPLPMKYRKYDEEAESEINQKSGEEDGYNEEIVVDYAPDARKILLIRPLSRVAPDGKRPHVSMHYRRTPRYIYGAGMCADLRDLQAGANKSWNSMYDYGDLANMPWGFYSPGATGLLPEIGSLEPGRMYETMDPRGIYFHKFNMDPNFYMMTNSSIQNWTEKVSNATENLQGKSPTTPNAPRTARGQLAAIQMSGVQFAILTGIHSESFIEVFRRVHAYKRRWAAPQESFRVMNKETGMFEKREISDKAFQYDADFDFQLNPNRTQAQQVSQALFGMTMSAIQQAIAMPMLSDMIRGLTSDVYRDLGRKDFDQKWPKAMVQNIVTQAMANNAQNQQGQAPGGQSSQAPPVGSGPAPDNLSSLVDNI